MTLTLLVVVNVALFAALVVVVAFVSSWAARLTPHRSAESSTAPALGPGATDLPRGPAVTHVPRSVRPVRSGARASVRT
jgi:hypothetical protein